ncbi:MAG: hypothetical protein NTU95_01375 [Methanothrix sp.]|nr:hypothetical protein [Methanothrix sp.]
MSAAAAQYKEDPEKSRPTRAGRCSPPGGLARVGEGEQQKGKSLDFAPANAPSARAIDPVTFKYWKWKWLKAHHIIKGMSGCGPAVMT